MDENSVGRVVRIWRYPIKSMLGEEIDGTVVTERGVLGDRGYALFDPETQKVASAKDPRRWPDMFRFRAEYVRSPSESNSLPPVKVALPSGELVTSDDSDAESRIAAAMGRTVRLLRNPFSEATAEGYWPDHEWIEARNTSFEYQFPEGTFFDGSMVHVISTTTLEHLSNLYSGSIFAPQRFRANLLIQPTDGATGFVENEWIGKSLVIGTARLKIERPCPRCVMTTLAQSDLPKDPTILRAAVRENSGNVGVYAKVEAVGEVRTGDVVRLVACMT